MSREIPADVKVLLVMNPLPLHSGVGEVQLRKALDLLAGSCQQPVVVTANANPDSFPDTIMLFFRHDARGSSLLGKVWKQLRSQLKMAQLCRAALKHHGPFDSIVFWVGAEQLLAQLYLRLRRQRTTVYLYGTPQDIPGSGRLTLCLSKLRSGMRSMTTRLASHVAIEAPGIDLPPRAQQKAIVIPLGIEIPPYTEDSARENIVLYAGRLADCKGLPELMAAARDSSWPQSLKLVIAGDGILRQQLEESSAGMAHVEMLGWLSPRELTRWMQRCRYVILPSETEGLPNALMEGMANGAIPIATAVGGIPHLLEDFRLGQRIEEVSSRAIVSAIQTVSQRQDYQEHAAQCRASICKRYAREVSQATLRRHLVAARHGRTLILSNLLPGMSEGQSNLAKHLEARLQAQGVRVTHRNLKSAVRNPLFWLGLRRFGRIHLVFRYNHQLSKLLRVFDFLVPGRLSLWALQPPLHKPLRHAAVDSVFCLSQQTADKFEETGVVPRLVRCGIDLQRFSPNAAGAAGVANATEDLRQSFGIAANDKWILHVGPVRENRGLRHLAELASLPGVAVTLLSRPNSGEDPGLRAFLEHAGVHVSAERVSKIETLYHSADLMVFPTTDPSGCIELPLSVLEALACGLPVISLPFGGLMDHFPKGAPGFQIVLQADDLRAAVRAELSTPRAPQLPAVDLSPFDWERGLHQALAAVPTGRGNAGKLVVVTGLDGAGKSTLLANLATELRAEGYRVIVPWCGYEMRFLRPFVKLAKRMAGASPERMESDYHGYRKAMVGAINRPLVGPIYRVLVACEYAVQVFWKVRLPLWRGQIVLADRYVHDICVAFAANSDENDTVLLRRTNRWKWLAPTPHLKLFIDVPPEVSMARKDDIPDLEYLTSRRNRYRAMTEASGFLTLDGTQSRQEILAQALTETSSLLGGTETNGLGADTEGAAGNRA